MIAGLPGVDNGLTPIKYQVPRPKPPRFEHLAVLEMLLLDDLILFWR